MTTREFKPGFRLSAIDVAVLILGAIGSIVVARYVWWLGLAVAVVVGHFLLFCNVFRISRLLELAWSAVFVALAASTVSRGSPPWPVTLALTLVVTVVVVAIEIRKPSYHGVGWQWINPGLRQWWDTNIAGLTGRST